MTDSHEQACASFIGFVWDFYQRHHRVFAWRDVDNPYYVVVSEIMLQQTQTHRVIPKYEQFITTFPHFTTLAQAPLRDVLSVWQGLGYNRRAKALHEIACTIEQKHAGQLPNDINMLQTLPGIGPATAASICAFAFNQPTVFIETNIRTVFIHSFFTGRDQVHDKELIPLIAKTVDQHNPRQWYYALMDYGSYLKKQYPNPSRRSTHHTKQSKFEGSDRQIRGTIITLLTSNPSMTEQQIIAAVQREPTRITTILEQLVREKLITQRYKNYLIM
jgi:A/G-specific adenine glycosylase